MENNKILENIQSCIDCKTCMEECDTFAVTQDELKSPNGRLKIAEKIFSNKAILEEEIISLYTCTLCGACNLVCKQKISIADIIHASKIKLVEQNKAPLEIHRKIIKDILDKDNSVNGNPEERLNWLSAKYKESELFEQGDSDTLLYLGCMSSFRVKESARASYEILKKGGYNFKILENEPCCGEYIYSAGDLKLAIKIFKENFRIFKKYGIKNLIVTCGGCLYAFNEVYPKYLQEYDLNVKHIVQVTNELVDEGKLKLKPIHKIITYHDSCRMGRRLKGMKIYDEPRILLNKIHSVVNELPKNRDITPCCGAGSGIRGVDSSICIKIGSKILNDIQTKEIVTSCPLCVFNFRYVNYKAQMDKKCQYITDYLFESIQIQ
ncbi:MAG: (Fe-S)-binding protein [Candidatus Thorarchaeota archaeon]